MMQTKILLNWKRFILVIIFIGLLVGFNGISTSIGYLMPEWFYTYYVRGAYNKFPDIFRMGI